MKVDQHQQADKSEPFELYRPISEWVESLYGAAEDDDVTARYYRALDQIVRHPDFDLDDLREVLVNGWVDFADHPSSRERIDEIIWCSRAIRQFLEAKGEANTRPGAPADNDQLVH
jgi:hypothetical protein